MARTLVAAAVATFALVAAGCGGDESSASAADEWADGFCTAMTTWRSSLETIADGLTASLSEDALRDAADDAGTATRELADDLERLGTPDTGSGQEVKSSVDDFLTAVEDEIASIEETANEVSGIAELPGAISSITTSVAAAATAFQTTWETIQDADVQGELRTALEDSPACDGITS